MASVESEGELAEDAPYEALLSTLALKLQVLDDSAKVSIATVLHIQVQVLARFQMLAVVVGNDVGVSEVGEDLEFGMKLFTLLLGHPEVGDLLAAHDEAICLSSNFADDAKGAMAYFVRKMTLLVDLARV